MDQGDKSTVVRLVRIAHGPRPGEVACLEVLSGTREGTVLPLTTGSTLVGRAPRADLRLEDDGVSRRHAKLAIGEEGIVNLIDLGSTNGTFLNAARIDLAIVREGDRIQIGPDVTLRFLYRARADLTRRDPKARAAEVGLSKRELEVAVLVAEGLTSDEIAARLGIASRTVTTHLTRIYERLELPGRAALARFVAQHNLLSPG